MHQPLDRFAPCCSKLGERGLNEQSAKSAALMFTTDGGDHQVAMIVPHAPIVGDETFVRSDADYAALGDGDDHLAISIRSVRVGTPFEQSANDFGDLVQPQTRAADVERFELLGVARAGVTNDHASDDSMVAIDPFGFQARVVGFGVDRLRPPLARLRFGSTLVASRAAESL